MTTPVRPRAAWWPLLARLGGVAVAGAAAATAITLARGPSFASQAIIAPQAPDNQARGLAGLASQFGIALGGAGVGGSSESIDFYARLIKSRGLLEELAASPIPPSGGGDAVSLAAQLFADESDSARRIRRTVERLRERILVSSDLKAGLLTIRIAMPTAPLAERTNRRLIELVAEFNTNRRQSQARAERVFLESRLAEATEEQRKAEAALTAFAVRNRSYVSPVLQLERARLQREVDLRQSVTTTLAQGFERARLDEVRNTPVFTVLEAPEGSARSQRSLLLAALAGAAVAVLVAAGVVAIRRELPRLLALVGYGDR